MQSLRCRIFLFMLRNRHLFSLNLRKETADDWENDIHSVRESAAKSSRMFGRLPKGLQSVPISINGSKAEWIEPTGAVRDKVIMYFRGGGYVLGSIHAHRGIVAKFAKGCGLSALLFEYPNAPEHPYPAALDRAVDVYLWLLDQGIEHSSIVFSGDSAGGGLLLATLLRLRDEGHNLPAGAVALSPWTDVACTGESLKTNAHQCLAPPDSWLACRKHYAGANDPSLPYISPLYGEMSGLPPLYISVGEFETLLNDATRFAHKAELAGVDVTLRIGRKLCHCYPACAPIFTEATEALREICSFINKRLET